MTKIAIAILAIAAVAWSSAVSAGSVALEGEPIQGGLILGSTAPGTRVLLGDREVRVAPDGRFLFGFHRDAPQQAILAMIYPDGEIEEIHLDVGRRAYETQRIDGLPSKLVTPPPEVMVRIKREQALVVKARSNDRAEPLFESGFVWPTHGIITGVYGSQRILNGQPRQPHYGIDIAAAVGTPVRAPADGVVTLAEPDLYFSGGTMIVDHGHGLSSAFLHLETMAARVGDRVAQGDLIATVGATGRVTGAHLDWRMNWFDARIDPSLLVGPMPATVDD